MKDFDKKEETTDTTEILEDDAGSECKSKPLLKRDYMDNYAKEYSITQFNR